MAVYYLEQKYEADFVESNWKYTRFANKSARVIVIKVTKSY